MEKPIILICVAHYYPGYKGGGPSVSIKNIIDALHNEFQFLVITHDRDLGDHEPYPNIDVNNWVPVGNALVKYLSPELLSISKLVNLVNATAYDVLYLNSFFDHIFTFNILLNKFFGRLKNKPIIISPRGEFIPGCLTLKKTKKKFYLKIVNFLHLCRGVIWHATTEDEKLQIAKEMEIERPCIHVAVNIPRLIVSNSRIPVSESSKYLKVIFLSRITPEKNLLYALQTLRLVASNVFFDVYGTPQDAGYFRSCQQLAALLPSNIVINFCGPVLPQDVPYTFSCYDLFLFPTLGENFGHVIAESLMVGTRVLTTVNTPWRDLASSGLGWDLDLDNIEMFAKIIEAVSKENLSERNYARRNAMNSVLQLFQNLPQIDAHRQIFIKAIATTC